MKLALLPLLILVFSCIVFGQKMTDRDLDRLSGKVKVVQVWNQKVRLDGTLVEEATTDYS